MIFVLPPNLKFNLSNLNNCLSFTTPAYADPVGHVGFYTNMKFWIKPIGKGTLIYPNSEHLTLSLNVHLVAMTDDPLGLSSPKLYYGILICREFDNGDAYGALNLNLASSTTPAIINANCSFLL
jgi:hypothetical protein